MSFVEFKKFLQKLVSMFLRKSIWRSYWIDPHGKIYSMYPGQTHLDWIMENKENIEKRWGINLTDVDTEEWADFLVERGWVQVISGSDTVGIRVKELKDAYKAVDILRDRWPSKVILEDLHGFSKEMNLTEFFQRIKTFSKIAYYKLPKEVEDLSREDLKNLIYEVLAIPKNELDQMTNRELVKLLEEFVSEVGPEAIDVIMSKLKRLKEDKI